MCQQIAVRIVRLYSWRHAIDVGCVDLLAGLRGKPRHLARSGHGRNEKLWTVAQAISEVLPDGDKEKQLLQGLLNQRDKIDEALAQERLF